ncbi:MAG: ATP-binding protein [Betaproteobacteria bacterium]|nr:ATP-binding protein [Betaproteobacteria bacterium]
MMQAVPTLPYPRGAAPNATLQLRVPAVRQALEPARLAVLRFLEPWALDARSLFNVELVLEETLINVSLHAFDDPGSHAVTLQVRVEPDTVLLQFEDAGRAFNPLLTAEPVRPASIADAQVGGLGLMLVRKLSRAVEYQRLEGRNRLTISVARGRTGEHTET